MTTTKIYKLTTQENTTHNDTKWIPGVWQTPVSGTGDLCTEGWYHAYNDSLIAILMNPIHADIKNPKLWLAEGSGEYKNDNGLKCGYSQMRIVKEIKIPEISITQKICFAILCTIE